MTFEEVVAITKPHNDKILAECRVNTLADLLTVACALIEIEARDHQQNHAATKEQRQAIAATLEKFTKKARAEIAKATEKADRQ